MCRPTASSRWPIGSAWEADGRTTVSRVGAPASCAGLRSSLENGGRRSSRHEPSVDGPSPPARSLVPVTSRPRSGSHDARWLPRAATDSASAAVAAGRSRCPTASAVLLALAAVPPPIRVGPTTAERRGWARGRRRSRSSSRRTCPPRPGSRETRFARSSTSRSAAAPARALLERLRRRTDDDRRGGDRAVLVRAASTRRATRPHLRRQRVGRDRRRSRHDSPTWWRTISRRSRTSPSRRGSAPCPRS
jgi:hypothetical protein